ncbi:hypothetical protein D3C87_2090630 [compost metagenome]
MVIPPRVRLDPLPIHKILVPNESGSLTLMQYLDKSHLANNACKFPAHALNEAYAQSQPFVCEVRKVPSQIY